jgi:hypothetical protein
MNKNNKVKKLGTAGSVTRAVWWNWWPSFELPGGAKILNIEKKGLHEHNTGQCIGIVMIMLQSFRSLVATLTNGEKHFQFSVYPIWC